MAPVYLAQKEASSSSGPNVFKTRGIAGFIPSTVTSLTVVGLPRVRELAFDGYYRNIDAFMFATRSKARVFCDLKGFTSNFTASTPIDIPHPDVAYASSVTMKSDEEEKFRGIVKAYSMQKVGKTTVFNLRKPGPSTLSNLISTCSNAFSAGANSVTPLGYKAYLFVRDCVSEFLATHSYSAFTDYNMDNAGPSEMLGLKSIKRENPIAVHTLSSKKMRSDYQSPTYHYSLDDDDEPDTEEAREAWGRQKEDSHYGIKITNSAGIVLRAKPSPHKSSNNFGPVSSMPKMGGIAFPYFLGMNTPDPLMHKIMVSQFFIRLLGSDSKSVTSNYIALRRGFNSLATTDVGKSLAHMLAGIKLALDTQSRLYVIYDDEYRGFCLLGKGFQVIHEGQVFSAQTEEELQKDLSSFNTHAKGLAGVLEALNKLSMEELSKSDLLEAKDIDDPSKLVAVLNELRVNEEADSFEDWEKEINASLKLLQFYPASKFHKIHPDSTLDLINTIREYTPTGKVPDFPFRFTKWNAAYMSSLYRCLAAFGTEAPSPWNNSGAEITLAEDKEKDEGTTSKSGQKRKRDADKEEVIPGMLIFSPKLIELAHKDWTRVIEKSAVKMDMKERAKGYRCMTVVDEEKRKGLWKALKEMIVSVPGSGSKDNKNNKGKGREVESKFSDAKAFLSASWD